MKMHFSWILLTFACLLLSCATSSRKFGGGGNFRSSSGVSRGATSFSRPSFSASRRFTSSPSFVGRGSPTNTFHIPRPASAPPLSSLPPSSFPNSLHVPRPASAPPLSALSGLPALPPRTPLSASPPISTFSGPPKSGSAIPQPPPIPPTVPTQFNVPKNVPKKGSNTASEIVITPVAVRPIMTIPVKRNTTNSQENTVKPRNPISNFGNGNVTSQHVNPLAAGNNSTKSFENNIKSVKVNEIRGSPTNATQNWGLMSNGFGRNATINQNATIQGLVDNFGNSAKGNNTIKGSPTNAINNWDAVGNMSGRNVTGHSNINGTLNGFPSNFSGNNTMRNFTLNSNGINVLNGSLLANHTRHNNTGNATGLGFPTGVSPITGTHVSPIANFPWQAGKDGSSAQYPNMPSWDNPPPKYDETNGDPSRKPRNDMVGDIAKKIFKSVASKQSGSKAAKQGLDSSLNGNSWDSSRTEFVSKSSSMSKSPPTPQSKIKKYQIILITVLISVVLIAGGVLVYFCNRN